jgi:DNA-binding transcriptional MerR regulator
MDEVRKTYYSISEVCKRTSLEPHVLRYWESEFPQLRPKKNRAGNRAYREKDIEVIQYIKYLLYVEQFTIPGAKKKLAGMTHAEIAQTELSLGTVGVPAAHVPDPAPAPPSVALPTRAPVEPPPVNGGLRPDIQSAVLELRRVLEFIKS